MRKVACSEISSTNIAGMEELGLLICQKVQWYAISGAYIEQSYPQNTKIYQKITLISVHSQQVWNVLLHPTKNESVGVAFFLKYKRIGIGLATVCHSL